MLSLDAMLRHIQLRIFIFILITGFAQAADDDLARDGRLTESIVQGNTTVKTGTRRDANMLAAGVSDLEIVEDVDREFVQTGEQVVFTLTVTNHGPDSAYSAQVMDIFPYGLAFIDATPAPSGGVDTLIWILDLAPLPPHNVACIQIYAKTTRYEGGMNNTAAVTDDNFDPDLTNNSSAAQIHNFLPVELSAFRAVPGNGCIVIEWETQSETENLGFHLYRAENSDGPFIQINESMIKGAGTTQTVHKYSFVDVVFYQDKFYYYQLQDVDFSGTTSTYGPVSVSASIPLHYELKQNFPNPFNSETRIEFQLRLDGFCELLIYNISGQQVRRLVAEYKRAGLYRIQWDGLDDSGNPVPGGMYPYQLCLNGMSDKKKMCFVK